MKKLISVLFVAILAVCLCACVPNKTTYDGVEVLRIETVRWEGFAPFPRTFERTFDFEHGKITDARKADDEYLDKDNRNEYNRPKKIATFTAKQGQALVDEIGDLGFFDWKERYETDEVINDAGANRINVYFADGTEKSTLIYFMDPPNYGQICDAIEKAFGVKIYSEL